MASAGIVGGVSGSADLAPGDQRAMGRKVYRGRAGFSPGGFSIQNDEAGDMLRYLADVSRTGSGTPRKTGFAGVQRRR